MAFLYPENEEYSDDIEQQNNSKTAIASGELIGKKLSGDKEVASVNDGNFVSENQTDFIFAVAGEEYGFMGCCSIVILLLAICLRHMLRLQPRRTSPMQHQQQLHRCQKHIQVPNSTHLPRTLASMLILPDRYISASSRCRATTWSHNTAMCVQ